MNGRKLADEGSNDSIHVLNVFPDVYTDELAGTIQQRDEIAETLKHQTNGSVTMTTAVPERGAASLEDPVDVVTNAPYIIETVQQVDEPYDAIVIDCFGDPALDALRQIVDVPVVGANQAACSVATQLGRTFSVISILEEIELLLSDLATKYGFSDQLSSIRTVETEVLELEQHLDETAEKIALEAKEAAIEDDAHSVVLGCTGMNSVRQKATSLLEQKGIDIPVVEPLSVGIQTAVMEARLGLTPSRRAYHPPREKKRIIQFDIQGNAHE